ncbi:methyltransferase [Agaribacter flavus]|uniref:Methyltransferase n=1 Tax=Agaribacter flavus TaxID=1902781 RepID=A0ABV7FIK9_9ALTE
MSSFDGIANKFDKNIYGTSKGRLRHALLCHYLQGFVDSVDSINVVDLGGGTGVMSKVFAASGHSVLLTDISKDVLAIAKHRLSDYQNVDIKQQSIYESISNGSLDNAGLVLCHAVLEWLPDPMRVVRALIERAPINCHLSFSFFNHDANLFANALYGNFDYINKGLKVKNQVRLNPQNPVRPTEFLDILRAFSNVEIVHDAGLRCFHDYMFDREKVEERYQDILSMEKKFGASHPYKYLGKYYHCLIKKCA